MARGSRLPAEIRRRQIVETAGRLLLEQGHLPLPAERLAAAAGVSKALVHSHFPDQHGLFNAVLAAEFDALEAAGLDAASRAADLQTAALACARLYFEHVRRRGTVAHLILRDPYMVGRLDRAVAVRRDRPLRRLARLVRRELDLPPDEAVGAISLATAIPEDAGRLVWQGDISPATGIELCERLVGAAIEALRPA